MNYKNKTLTVFILSAFVLGGFSVSPAQTRAQTSATITPCNFAVDLEVGSEGEDVRCLQKFLNSNGFKVADVGVGSPGNETNLFGSLTREAVKRWQAASGITSTGTFGPLSKAEYLKKVAAQLTNQVSSLSPSNVINTPGPLPIVTPVVPVESAQQKEARKLIKEAREALEDAEDDLDDADWDADEIEDAEDDIADAKEDMIDALYFFIDEDYTRAISKAEDVIDSMNDILEDVNGDQEDASDAIDDARDAIDDARDEIDEADDDGERVRESRDLLEEAEDLLEDAEDAFDDRDYDEARDLAEEAEDLADDAVDAIGE
jgi:hypothetical protein